MEIKGDFNDLDIFWKGSVAEYEQYKRFLEWVDDKILMQVIISQLRQNHYWTSNSQIRKK